MEHLFFNLDNSLAEAARVVFAAVCDSNGFEGHSANVHGGAYFQNQVNNLVIRVESNSYDFEDEYAFMITVKNNPLSSRNVNDVELQAATRTIQRLLANKLQISVALEIGSNLETLGEER